LAAIRSHTINLYFFQLLTESLKIQHFLQAFGLYGLGYRGFSDTNLSSPTDGKNSTFPDYKNEPLITIKVDIVKTKKFTAANQENKKS
jgi:hypothetical protein